MKRAADPYLAFERRLGYHFRDPALLRVALTHRSTGPEHNERLEFLGDAVLNCVIAETVFKIRPEADEGDLSRLRAHLVREASLAELATELDVGEALILGPGETVSGSYRRHSLLADALESVIGAVFLDGGMDAVRETIQRVYASLLSSLPPMDALKDPKTRLQEYLQGRSLPLPVYEVLSVTGPQHRQQFVLQCRLQHAVLACEGQGSSRRRAEQAAAEAMLARLMQETQV